MSPAAKLLIQQHTKQWLAERVVELQADNVALQWQVEGLREALREAKVTLESIEDEHPQTEYALKKVEQALEAGCE